MKSGARAGCWHRKAVAAQTLRWDEAANRTVVMRSKEEAGGYRYLPEPDLPPLILDEAAIARACRLPELPLARKARFIGAYGLSEADAHILIGDRMLADWFEAAVAAGARPRPAANWVLGEVARLRKETRHLPCTPADLARLIDMTERGAVSVAGAKGAGRARRKGRRPGTDCAQPGSGPGQRPGATGRGGQQAVGGKPRRGSGLPVRQDRALRFLLGKAMKLGGRAIPQLLRELVLQAIADAERL